MSDITSLEDHELYELTHEIHAERIRTGQVSRFDRYGLDESHLQALRLLDELLAYARQWDRAAAAERDAE